MAMLRSIGSKIFSIALVLITLMLITSMGTSWVAREVDEELERVEQHYVPAYADLSQAEVKSLEVALALRQFVYQAEHGGDPATLKLLRERVDELESAATAEIIKARGQLKFLLAENDAYAKVERLARLDTRLEFLLEMLEKYEVSVRDMILAVEAGDLAGSENQMRLLDRRRAEINRHLERDHADMYASLKYASDNLQIMQHRASQASMALTVIACILGLLAAGYLTRNLVRPVRRLLEGARQVEHGSLEVDLPVRSRDEIGELTQSFNMMVGELKKKERIRDTFGRYMDPRIVDGLLMRPDLAHDEGERRVMTVLFCDMQGFTGLSERLTPTALVTVINRYLTLMSEPIRANDGVIDKYIGDAVMAYWGPPFVPAERQAELACRAALDMLDQLERFRAELPDLLGLRREVPPISIRIGIATGDVVVGSIGSEFSRSYSLLGDTVNLAARLESANRYYGSTIMLAEATRRMVGPGMSLRELDRLRVAGKQEAEVVYELYGRQPQPQRDAAFADALAAYRKGDWPKARNAFATLADGDAVAATFLHRVEKLQADAPTDWTGDWTFTEK